MLREKLGSSRRKRLNYFIVFNSILATICRLHISFQSSTDEICEFPRQKLAAGEFIPHEILWTGNGFWRLKVCCKSAADTLGCGTILMPSANVDVACFRVKLWADILRNIIFGHIYYFVVWLSRDIVIFLKQFYWRCFKMSSSRRSLSTPWRIRPAVVQSGISRKEDGRVGVIAWPPGLMCLTPMGFVYGYTEMSSPCQDNRRSLVRHQAPLMKVDAYFLASVQKKSCDAQPSALKWNEDNSNTCSNREASMV